MKRFTSAVVFAVLVLAAYGDGDTAMRTENPATTHEGPVADQPLTGTDWTVIGFVDGDSNDLVAAPGDTPGAVRFEENGFVSGHDGCNGFGYVVDETATDAERAELGLVYEVEAARITFTGSSLSTLRGCLGTNHERYSQAVRAVLRGTVTYEIDGRQLTLRANDGRGVIYTTDG